ncbi:MAG: hypothetical protein NT068_00440 [Candidatus Nomurabacteria bacterium]|nr:hypothetical protein [Candidatus Nomurabacteria bacterium]
MIELKDLLGKYNDLFFSGSFKKDTIRTIISEEIGFEIKSEDIEIKNGTVQLNIKPIYKNEIFMKQEKILAKLTENLGKKAPQDIR